MPEPLHPTTADPACGAADAGGLGDTLAVLSRRLQAGDREAHAALFRRFYAPLVRYARRIVGSEATAADVVQDVFLKLWRTHHTLEIRASVQALLYIMTRNRALNVKRSRRREAADVPVEEAYRRQGLHTPAPGAAAEAEELRQHLRRWIEELPERRAEAFILSRNHGLSHQEIARVMCVSKRTVDTHIYHALCTLRERLDALRRDDCTPP